MWPSDRGSDAGRRPERSSNTGTDLTSWLLTHILPQVACCGPEGSAQRQSIPLSCLHHISVGLCTKGDVIFSWDQCFVCSLEATLPLESSQNTAACPPLPPSLPRCVPPCLLLPSLHIAPSTRSPTHTDTHTQTHTHFCLFLSVSFSCHAPFFSVVSTVPHKQIQWHSKQPTKPPPPMCCRAEIYFDSVKKCWPKKLFFSLAPKQVQMRKMQKSFPVNIAHNDCIPTLAMVLKNQIKTCYFSA